jgi:hypothetical protein
LAKENICDTYVDKLEARLTELRAENERLRGELVEACEAVVYLGECVHDETKRREMVRKARAVLKGGVDE